MLVSLELMGSCLVTFSGTEYTMRLYSYRHLHLEENKINGTGTLLLQSTW